LSYSVAGRQNRTNGSAGRRLSNAPRSARRFSVPPPPIFPTDADSWNHTRVFDRSAFVLEAAPSPIESPWLRAPFVPPISEIPRLRAIGAEARVAARAGRQAPAEVKTAGAARPALAHYGSGRPKSSRQRARSRVPRRKGSDPRLPRPAHARRERIEAMAARLGGSRGAPDPVGASSRPSIADGLIESSAPRRRSGIVGASREPEIRNVTADRAWRLRLKSGNAGGARGGATVSLSEHACRRRPRCALAEKSPSLGVTFGPARRWRDDAERVATRSIQRARRPIEGREDARDGIGERRDFPPSRAPSPHTLSSSVSRLQEGGVRPFRARTETRALAARIRPAAP